MQLVITDAGKALLIGCLTNHDSQETPGTLTFDTVAFGDGAHDEPKTATALDNQKAYTNVTSITADEGHEFVTLGATFTNSGIASGFKITEMGVFAHGTDNVSVLLAYGTEEENNADYVPAATSGLVEMGLSIIIYLGDTANITIATATSAVEAVAAALAAHIADDNNPHHDSPESIGAAAAAHTHAAADIDSGSVSVTYGGTGRSILSANAILAGNGTDAVGEIPPASGALYAKGTSDPPRFGTLPVGQGGSGRTSHTTNAILTGNGGSAVKNVPTASGSAYAESTNGELKFGTLPVHLGGTGATNQASARDNLNITPANIGAVNKNGDKMLGDLLIEKTSYPSVAAKNTTSGQTSVLLASDGGNLNLINEQDANNKKYLTIEKCSVVSLDKLVQMAVEKNGVYSFFSLFGQHNLVLMAAAIQTMLQGGNITMVKSVQRGQVAEGSSESGSITINEVDMSKTFVNLLGHSPLGTNGGGVEIWLSSATTLSYTRGSSVSSGTSGPAFSWEVVEYY